MKANKLNQSTFRTEYGVSPLNKEKNKYYAQDDSIDDEMFDSYLEDNSMSEFEQQYGEEIRNMLLDESLNNLEIEMNGTEMPDHDSLYYLEDRSLIKSKSSKPDTSQVNYIEYFAHIKRNIDKTSPFYESQTKRGARINPVGLWRPDLSRHSFNGNWLSMTELHEKYSHIHTVNTFSGLNATILTILLRDIESLGKIKRHKNSVTSYVYIEPTPGMMNLKIFKDAANRGEKSIIRFSFPRAKSARHRRCIMPVLDTRDNTLRLCLYKVQEKTDLLNDIINYSSFVKKAVVDENARLTLFGMNKSLFSSESLQAFCGKREMKIGSSDTIGLSYKGKPLDINIVGNNMQFELTTLDGQRISLDTVLNKSFVIHNASTTALRPEITFDTASITINGEKGFSFIAGTLAVLY